LHDRAVFHGDFEAAAKGTLGWIEKLRCTAWFSANAAIFQASCSSRASREADE
jgi:hypothetical protein